jgi:hypothetical protein
MRKVLIQVGHSAYKGSNAYRLCFSRTQAVRVLCNRGLKRATARSVVAKAMTNGGASTNARGFVEVVNMQWSFEQGYFYDTYENLKAKWAAAPEL